MKISDYVQKMIATYHTDNVRELVDYHDIDIIYFNPINQKCDSVLFINQQIATISLKSDLNPLYENFLLAHELGHYVLHYDNHISFSFLLQTRKNALEREANEFACRLLLNDIDLKKENNIEFVIKEKGIPIQIWRSICDYIF